MGIREIETVYISVSYFHTSILITKSFGGKLFGEKT